MEDSRGATKQNGSSETFKARGFNPSLLSLKMEEAGHDPRNASSLQKPLMTPSQQLAKKAQSDSHKELKLANIPGSLEVDSPPDSSERNAILPGLLKSGIENPLSHARPGLLPQNCERM